jgi:predicted nuclease with TOPRIM domain
MRKDLPEELRQYKNPKEIIKQFGHARTYANTAEERLKKLAAENEELRTKSQQLPDLEKQLGELKQRLTTTASSVTQIPGQSEVGKQAVTSRMKELKQKIADLDKLTPEELLAEPEKLNLMKSTMASIGGEFDRYDNEMNQIRATSETANRRYDELAKKVDTVYGSSQQEIERQKRIATTNTVIRQIATLQDSHPELKTSMPIFGTESDITPTVEGAAWKFAEKVMLAREGRTPRSWAEANAIINAYNRNDQNLRSFLSSNGISPKDAGCNDNDFLAYATVLNVDAMTRGERLDDITGRKVIMTSEINGQQVNFPNHKAAYEYLLNSTGYSKALRERQLADAEMRGQTGVIESVQRASVQPRTIGKEGSMASDEAGGVMSKEDATRILATTDEFDMDRRATAGDRSLFKLYQAAQKVLGLQEGEPSPSWPPEKRAQ